MERGDLAKILFRRPIVLRDIGNTSTLSNTHKWGRLRKLERAKGFEPSTPTLARLCSTPELHPHPGRQLASADKPLLCQMGPRIATVSAAVAQLKAHYR